MKYQQLTHKERYQIGAYLKIGLSQAAIAREVGVAPSTISRELKRNRGGRGYRPEQADRFARERRQRRARRPRIAGDHWEIVEQLVREDWSPEQISRRLRLYHEIRLSHEWIYCYIYRDKREGGTLHRHLRCRKRNRKRYGAHDRRGQIAGRRSIEERPAIVDQRCRRGDWEVDTVYGRRSDGHQSALVTLVERKSRYCLLAKVDMVTADAVGAAIINCLAPLRDQVLTITADNGKEFMRHQEVAHSLAADFYFAHPYSSWERGLNENTNGLVRQYFRKGRDFGEITAEDLQWVMNRLNQRPRKCLGFATPEEVFYNLEEETPVALRS